jgi:phosphatidylserine/phosphatidylglycerophosphate/cardiolipin synthase-like enzyme
VDRRRVSLTLVQDRAHYDVVIDRALRGAQVSVWIATANVKDVHLEAPVGTRARARGRYVSILEIFEDLSARGVEVRVLHGCPPSRPFRERLRKNRRLRGVVAMRRCPRVHMKMIAVDGALLYLGSANFTGAGLGAKSDGRRNFETGIVTDDELVLDEMQATFEAIWSGRRCGACQLRGECPAPLDARQ